MDAPALPMLGPLRAAFEAIEHRYRSPGAIYGLALGLPALDHCIGGLEPGDLLVLGSANPVLRQSLALHIASQVASTLPPHEGRVDIYSLHDNALQVTMNAIAQFANIPRARLRSGQLRMEERQHAVALTQTMARWPWHIDSTPERDADTIDARMERLGTGVPLRLAVIDDLQSAAMNRRGGSMTDRLVEQCYVLKNAARRQGAAIVATSGLNKHRRLHGGAPDGIDLYGAGLIADIANLAILLEPTGASTVDAILLHDREGDRRRFPLTHDRATGRWQCEAPVTPAEAVDANTEM